MLKELAPGPLFKTQNMEEKWDIYFIEDSHFYFCRSWTGALVFRAEIELTKDKLRVIAIEASREYTLVEIGLVEKTVDFLIKSHLFNLNIPVYVPYQFRPKIAFMALAQIGNKKQEDILKFEASH